MPASNQEYIKSELLPCLGAGYRQIRSTAGTIISVLVQLGGVFGWPELLHTLVKCLDSNNLNHMEGAMDALSKVKEVARQLALIFETVGAFKVKRKIGKGKQIFWNCYSSRSC